MKPPAAVVQSVFDFAIREINALDGRIDKAETDADAMLWEQARQVVAQLDAGLSQRQLAAQWINGRTGEPYSQAHVSYVAQVYRDKSTYQPRPRFRDAYNAITNKAEWETVESYVAAARSVLGAAGDSNESTEPTNPQNHGAKGADRDQWADLEEAQERSRRIKQARAEHPEYFAADEIFSVLTFAVDESETWARHLKFSEWPGTKTAAAWRDLGQRLVTVTDAVLVKPSTER